MVRSFEPDELWGYCYDDDAFVEELPAFDEEAASVHYDPPR